MLWLYLERYTDVFARPQRVLHVAPEPYLRERLTGVHGDGYVHGDVADAHHFVDVTDLPFKDAEFDVALCSHVFEHVADDLQGMRDLRRVLKPSGWAVLDAPVDQRREVTLEDWLVTSAAGRRRAFGQWDHVRVYGRDYTERLGDAGWVVRVEDPWRIEQDEVFRFGLRPGTDRIYRAWKASTSEP